jgi:replicative DNA helicase
MSEPTICKEHPICQSCIYKHEEHYKDEGFRVKCQGICEPDELLPEEITLLYNDDELEMAESLYNPVVWAKRNFDWEPRISKDDIHYQEMMLRCTARRKALRLGRQSGKTEAICVLMLFRAFTSENYKVLVITPYRSQIELIFKRIKELIYMSPDLQNSVRREVANPYHEIEFFNGSYIRGFTSGSKTSQGAGAVRGQPADMIVLDEADYLTTDDINAVVAILNSRPHCELYASSTPTGRRDHFYRWCQEAPHFKEFHFPSYVIPHWNDELEMELRASLTEAGYIHEILAEFGEEEEGVFQVQFRELAEQPYVYSDIQPDHERYIFGMGVDWNSSNIGTEIYIVGWDKETKMFVGARAYTVSRIGWTQTAAMEKIKQLNRKWQPSFIYVDEGYGATQVEVMKLWSKDQQQKKALHNPDCRLGEILKAINFSSNIEIPDPLTNKMVKKDTKSYMIENAVRMFEREIFIFPKTDDILKKQLAGYIIQRRTPTGKPVFGAREERIGDHRLDAMMLAFLGFHLEFSDLVKREFVSRIAFAGNLRGPRKEKIPEGDLVVNNPHDKKENHPRNKLMPEDRSGMITQIGITGSRRVVGNVRDTRNLWNWPGFLKDAPPPSKPRGKTYSKRLRPRRGKF